MDFSECCGEEQTIPPREEQTIPPREWQTIPPWVQFLFRLGYKWPRANPKPRRIALVSMPCDSPAAGLIALGAMVHDLGNPRANDVDGHYDKLLKYAKQYLQSCKPCIEKHGKCNPDQIKCGYKKRATGKLRSPKLRGTVTISAETDFTKGELKWILNKTTTVTPEPNHTINYHIDGEPPCQWDEDAGELLGDPYQALVNGLITTRDDEVKVISENLRRSYSGLCFAGRNQGETQCKEVCDRICSENLRRSYSGLCFAGRSQGETQCKEVCDRICFRLADGTATYRLSELLTVSGWSSSPISRMAYFNSRTQKADRNVVTPTLVVADGDDAFLRSRSAFSGSDVIGVVHRTMAYDRLEEVGEKMRPDQWYAADTDLLCELPPKPKGISIAVLKRRNSP